MVLSRRALLPLLPAVLVAQAPDAPSYSQRLRAEAPAIEQLLTGLRPLDAQAKLAGLLPVPPITWDASNPQTQLASYLAHRDHIYACSLAARTADAAGDWEGALVLLQRARDLAKLNQERVEAHFPGIIKYYKDMAERGKATLAENAEYIAALKAKTDPEPGDLQQLDLVQKEGEGIARSQRNAEIYAGYLETAKKEADYYARLAEQQDGQVKALEKALEEYTYKNDKAKFVEGTLAAKGYLQGQYPDKASRVRFLYRLRQLAPGNRRAVKEIEAETGVSLPLPPEEKPEPRKRRK